MKSISVVWLTPLCIALSVRTALADNNSDSSQSVLNAMVVKGKTPPKDADSSTTKITSKQLEKQGASDLAQALRYEPGIDVASTSRFGVSGIYIRGLGDDRVYQSIDGVTLADAYNPSGSYIQSGRDAVDIDSLAAIDITKGGDVLAGSGALAGAVALRTKSPKDLLKAGNSQYRSIKTGFQSASNQYHETLTYAARHNSWEGLLLYTRRDGHETKSNASGDGLETSRGKADPASISSDNVLAKLNYQFNAHNQLGVTFEHYNNRSTSELLSQSSTSELDSANDHIYRTHLGIHQNLSTPTWAYDRLHWQLDYQDTKTTNGTHKVSSDSARYVKRFYDQRNYQLQAKLSKHLGDHYLSYGINYQYQRFDDLNDDSSATSAERMSPKATGQVIGLYAGDRWQLTDRWLIMPAVRYDHYQYKPKYDANLGQWDTNKNHALTAQLGSEFALTQSLSVFGKYGTGFRAPKMDEMYYTYIHSLAFGSYAITPNPNLKPERSIFLEGGLRFKNDVASAEITTYYNRYRNFIQTQQSIGTSSTYTLGQFTSLNLDKVVIHGIEAKGTLALSALTHQLERFTVQGALAYAKGHNVKDDEPLDSVAPLQINSSLSYHSQHDFWGSSLHVTWTDAKSSDDLTDSSSWLATKRSTVLDLTGYIKPLENLTINVGLYNLTNQKYWVWSNIHDANENTTGNLGRLSQPGRNFAVDLTYAF
ncbi:TonB-dependent hemoglobin/transferrin/lactoferrin family receptor [Celerinatantimonas sp. MCCC 1A17872]|uniref:TonB-dependent hemoglobin/transferrin/lactoferrin family receptor n=1 Tax=Celerinatantimonas sp. MCCC 1A17872 TaxID=3177514 RepID=UPI0038C804AB